MDIIKKAIKVGNSAGIILPKKLLGADVKVSVVKMPQDLRKEALKIADSYLEEISCLLILSKNPAEILALTRNVKKLINSNNIRFILMPINQLKRDIKENEQLRKKLLESEAVINRSLLISIIKESRIVQNP